VAVYRACGAKDTSCSVVKGRTCFVCAKSRVRPLGRRRRLMRLWNLLMRAIFYFREHKTSKSMKKGVDPGRPAELFSTSAGQSGSFFAHKPVHRRALFAPLCMCPHRRDRSTAIAKSTGIFGTLSMAVASKPTESK